MTITCKVGGHGWHGWHERPFSCHPCYPFLGVAWGHEEKVKFPLVMLPMLPMLPVLGKLFLQTKAGGGYTASNPQEKPCISPPMVVLYEPL